MTIKYKIFILAFAMTCHCAYSHPRQPGQTVNSILGDQSFVSKFGKLPDRYTGEVLRISTHLEYVETLLRNKDTRGLSSGQKAKRLQMLDLLHNYWKAGVFPRNADYQGGRMPCFIDAGGRICAVGYLVEQTAGRGIAEQINSEFQYEEIMDMNSPHVDTWIAESGLTKRECAMIQPEYGEHQTIYLPQHVWTFQPVKKEPDYKKKLDSQLVVNKELIRQLDSLGLALNYLQLKHERFRDSSGLALKTREENLLSEKKNHEKRQGQLYLMIAGLGILALGGILFGIRNLRTRHLDPIKNAFRHENLP